MKRILLFFIIAFLPLIIRAQRQDRSLSRTGKKIKPYTEWPTLRANNNRDGRIIAKGEFKNNASLSQSIDYSTSEAYIELSPAGTNSSITYAADDMSENEILKSLSTEWRTEPGAYFDLYGDGKITKISVAENVKYAKLFNGDKKYYRIEAHDGFSFATTNAAYVGIRVYEANTDKMVLERKFPEGVFMQRPHVTVADMNNDEQKDIVITSWEGVYVFNNKGDSIAGLSQNTKGWHNLRKRGYASVADIDGNGYNDVIIIGSYPWHVDVIKNDRGVLKFGWTKIFEGHIESAKKVSKPILNSVSDFDGDGTYEVLVNVYNYNDDHNWSGILFDATNGKVKAQIRRAYVLSADDVNNDGQYFFFCNETQGHPFGLAAALKAVAFKNGEIKDILRIDKGEWVNPAMTNTSPTVTTIGNGVSGLGEDAVLCVDYENIGQKAFFAKTKNTDGSSSINGYYISKEGKAKHTALRINFASGMYGEIFRQRMNDNGKHNLLLQVKAFGTPGGTVQVNGARAKTRGRFVSPTKRIYVPVVADINSDGSPEILIPNDVEEILCFSPNAAGKMSLLWKVPGHGMLWQYSLNIDYGITVDDIDHDGYKEVIVSGANDVSAAIAVYDHKGKLLWQKGFPDINAGDITSFDGNITFFGTSQSSKRKHRDVIVTVQRVMQHTGRTYCLNGTDGAVLWQLDTLIADRGQGKPVVSGAGGNVFSTYDIDGDGSDEVMCGYGNILFFADTNDGTLKFKAFMRKIYLDKYDYPLYGYKSFWVNQILPVAFQNNGKLALACFNTQFSAGTMDTKGVLSWCPKNMDLSGRYWQCMANLDGDGKLWVVELSERSSDKMAVLFAYDPINGREHKTFSMEMSRITAGNEMDSNGKVIGKGGLYCMAGIMPAACDMNGDGRDEIIISNATGIHCIGYKNGSMDVLWEYLSPDCGPAVVADTDSDGFVEVVTATQGGKILILDK